MTITMLGPDGNNIDVPIEQAFARALQLHQQNSLVEAEEIYRNILSQTAGYFDALHLLGVVCAQTGRLEEAQELLDKAITSNPNSGEAFNNQGNVLYALKQFNEALVSYDRALMLKPDYAEALNNRGNVLNELKRFDEALVSFDKALMFKPDYAEALNNRGNVLYELRRFDESLACYDKAVMFKPDYADAIYGRGNVLYELKRFDEALACYDKAVMFKPDLVDALNNRGNVLYELNHFDEALESYFKALEINPEYAAAYNNLGKLYRQTGEREEAIKCYNKALELKPDYPEAHLNLALVHYYTPDDLSHAEQIKSALKNDFSESDMLHLNFAIGKIYDDCKMVDKAFKHYRAGNEIRYRHIQFNSEHHSQLVDRIMSVYSDSFFKTHINFGHDSRLPVLIVGMPRSGTTLVEQIISSHTKVAAAGELMAIHQMENSLGQKFGISKPYPENVTFLDQQNVLDLANEYVKHLKTFSADADKITDKLPDNFLSLGFFKLLFPGGHIIHCLRNPIDTCLSIYFQLFMHGNGYSYDLEKLGKYYNDYLRLMDYWRNSPHIKMYEVQYEELVNNQENICKEMIKYIGLEWDKKCMDFHKNKRPVRTASSEQVRRPIYKSSINRWKSYEKYLAILVETLNLH